MITEEEFRQLKMYDIIITKYITVRYDSVDVKAIVLENPYNRIDRDNVYVYDSGMDKTRFQTILYIDKVEGNLCENCLVSMVCTKHVINLKECLDPKKHAIFHKSRLGKGI